MVKVWDRGDVPRAASQRACLESAEIVGEVGDDDNHDVVWEATGRLVDGGCS